MANGMTSFICAFCGRESEKATGGVNRAKRAGARLYCNRVCAGNAHRKHKTKEQKTEEKRLYDAQRRIELAAEIKAAKAAYFQRTYDPAKAAVERKARLPYHVEYCRRPEYRAWKAEYDRQYRAKEYGEFADCYLLFLDLNNEVNRRMTDYEVRIINGTINKKQQRRREHDDLISG